MHTGAGASDDCSGLGGIGGVGDGDKLEFAGLLADLLADPLVLGLGFGL